MSLRLLTDEDVDYLVVHRLTQSGHDVQHVDSVTELGKGSTDAAIASYSLDSDRLILTSDDDFLSAFESEHYRGLLFVEDEQLTVPEMVEIIDTIADAIDHDQIESVLYVSRTWLASSDWRGSTVVV